MKIGFWEIDNQEKRDFFTKTLSDHEVVFFENPLREDCLPDKADFDIISIFTCSQITPRVINYFPDLKHLTVRATGFDNINLDSAKNKNIPVYNVPAYGSHTVAEFTFGLILALSRKIYQGVYRLKTGNDFNFEGLRGADLNGKTLGVIGTGKIGANVIKIAKGFNMKIIASDPYPNDTLAKDLNFTYTPLEELLRTSDIVTLHVPLMEQTKHLINRNNIFLMKKGGLLINTSRGGIVETEALFQAITNQHLGGAALDVLEEENGLKEEVELLAKNKISDTEFKTILEDHLLIHLPQVLITPHMAFYSKEAEFSILETTVKNIKSALAGHRENIVNP